MSQKYEVNERGERYVIFEGPPENCLIARALVENRIRELQAAAAAGTLGGGGGGGGGYGGAQYPPATASYLAQQQQAHLYAAGLTGGAQPQAHYDYALAQQQMALQQQQQQYSQQSYNPQGANPYQQYQR
jgi:hypothetical protein